jgi:mannosyltransferase
MKIIFDDIIYNIQKIGGISVYWSQLEKYLNPEKKLLYKGCENNLLFQTAQEKNISMDKYFFFTRYINVHLREMEYFIFHSSYYRYCKSENAINITTVFDFIYEYFIFKIGSNLHKWQKKNAINNSEGIICISNSTKNDLVKLYPKYNGLIKVIYLGFSQEYYNMNLIKKNTVVLVGGHRGYKNMTYAIKIMQRLIKYKLLIIGGGILDREEISNLNKDIPDRYEHYSYLSNKDLNIKYNEAQFLLFPSLYEGFGIPVLEAQAAGCPVVCCNASSLPEVAGDGAVYISGNDIDEDIKKIACLQNPAYYKNIVHKGFENCKKFSWEKCAKETYDFYEEVYRSKRPK